MLVKVKDSKREDLYIDADTIIKAFRSTDTIAFYTDTDGDGHDDFVFWDKEQAFTIPYADSLPLRKALNFRVKAEAPPSLTRKREQLGFDTDGNIIGAGKSDEESEE